MRVTLLNAHDMEGGAARAVYRLHMGLCALGTDSRMLTFYKKSADPTVVRFDPPGDLLTRLRRRLKRRSLERSWSRIRVRSVGAGVFSNDLSQHNADVLRALPQTDVLNLHWVAGIIDYRLFFRALPAGLPVVWTLHDMNAFTGGCHFDGGCGKFTKQCGACPQLGSSEADDLSSQIWLRKREAFSSAAGKKLRLVTPSHWLADEVRKSTTLGHCSLAVIPHGVETGNFQPRDRRLTREKLGVPAEAKIALFIADSAAEKRKGLSVLLEALRGLEKFEDFYFMAIGRGLADYSLGSRSKAIDFVEDEAGLSYVYSAADVFVIPSLQDNLPNTAIEALACGIPTIGSNVGGIPEIVRNRETGLVVPAGDARALGEAIAGLLSNVELRAAMSSECRRVSVAEYSIEIQAKRYAALYEEMLRGAGEDA